MSWTRQRSQGLIDEIRAEHGRLDFLVNNAMHVGWSAISETSLENFQQDFKVNVDAAFVATQTALRHMTNQGSGSILNVASINGLLAIDNMAAYSASKAALIPFLQGCGDGVRDGGRARQCHRARCDRLTK